MPLYIFKMFIRKRSMINYHDDEGIGNVAKNANS